MKSWHKHAIGIATAALITGGAVASMVALTPSHIGTDYLYPDSTLTPGVIATQDLTELQSKSSCGTYSACHRKTTEAMKQLVKSEYATSTCGEIDHLLPLSLGGADDVKNLSCQPLHNSWNGVDYGYKTKDAIEEYLYIQTIVKGSISIKDAQSCLLSDWVQCYNTYILHQSTFGAVNSTVDPDTL